MIEIEENILNNQILDNNTISLEELFILHNLNYNLEFLIISMPKTGTNYIENYLLHLGIYDFIKIHSMIELSYIDERFLQYSVNDLIHFVSSKTTYEKLHIIWSHREPLSRYISRYLWDIKVYNIPYNILENITEINSDDIFESIKNYDYDLCVGFLKYYNLNINNYKFDVNNGYTIIPYNEKINFIFTEMTQISKFVYNYFNMNEIIELGDDKKNKTEKNHKIITFDNKYKTIIYENEKEFVNFYAYLHD